MKTRLTLILVLLIYIGAASHTHAQQKKVIKTMMIAEIGRASCRERVSTLV